MAGGDSSDILMRFVLDGEPIAGESMTELDVPGRERSPLLNGFGKARMFAIDSFRFSVGLDDDSMDPTQKSALHALRAQAHPGAGGHPVGGAPAAPAVRSEFSGWRTGRNVKYGVRVQPITFTRSLDRASVSLLQYCIKCTSFDSAALIKRKSAGSAFAGEPYLRMDFKDGVLLTEVSWSNDEPVTETCKFICRAITVQYRPQLPDGSLGIIRPGYWSMRPWTEANL